MSDVAQVEASSSGAGSRLDRVFGIDTRSLAVFRMAIGALVVIDALTRLPLCEEFYTESGAVFLSQYTTLFGWIGEAWWPTTLLCVLALFGALLCIGVAPRVTGFVCWALLFDLHRRNPHVLDGGDGTLQHMMLFGLFVPLGARWSVDAWIKRRRSPRRVLSIGSAALLLQPAMIYFFSIFLKLDSEAWRDGTAAYYAVAQDIWARPLGDWIAARPGTLTTVLTYATLLAEGGCPLLLLSPWLTRVTRPLGIASLYAMQIGFAFTLELFLFPFVSMAALLPFIGGGLWDRLGLSAGGDGQAQAQTTTGLRWVGRSVCAVLIGFALLLNVQSAVDRTFLPGAVQRVASTIVPQGWTMYEDVFKHDFRLMLHGITPGGERVLMDDGRRGDGWEPMRRLKDDYRARTYLERIPSLEGEPAMLCIWAQRVWNETRLPKLQAVELSLVTRRNPLAGETADEHSSVLIVWPPFEDR